MSAGPGTPVTRYRIRSELLNKFFEDVRKFPRVLSLHVCSDYFRTPRSNNEEVYIGADDRGVFMRPISNWMLMHKLVSQGRATAQRSYASMLTDLPEELLCHILQHVQVPGARVCWMLMHKLVSQGRATAQRSYASMLTDLPEELLCHILQHKRVPSGYKRACLLDISKLCKYVNYNNKNRGLRYPVPYDKRDMERVFRQWYPMVETQFVRQGLIYGCLRYRYRLEICDLDARCYDRRTRAFVVPADVFLQHQ